MSEKRKGTSDSIRNAEEIERISGTRVPTGAELAASFCCPPSSTCKCNCGSLEEPRVCEHKWDGEEEVMDGGSSVTCSKCGMSAMSHDMRCC